MMMKGMNLYFWIAVIFSIAIFSFLLGYPSPSSNPSENSLLANYASGTLDVQTTLNTIISGIFSWQGVLGLAAIAAAVVLSGFNLIVLVPLGLLYFAINLIALPPKFIASMGIPPPVPELISMFFGLMVVMVIIAFLRSG
jgi:hypothetical protein